MRGLGALPALDVLALVLGLLTFGMARRGFLQIAHQIRLPLVLHGLDVEGYYAPLVQMLERAVTEGFMKPENSGLLLHGSNPVQLLREMAQYHPPAVAKRIK